MNIASQRSACPWGYSGSLVATGSVTSGSFSTKGNARLIGIVASDEALESASGVLVQQSIDSGSNWDYKYINTVSASGGSAFSLEMVGDSAKVTIKMAAASTALTLRTAWRLRPV